MRKKKKKLNYFRGKDCIKKLCKKLKEHAKKIINYEQMFIKKRAILQKQSRKMTYREKSYT